METLKVYAPFNLRQIDEIPMAGEEQIEKMLNTAHTLFKDQRKSIPAYRRIEILERLAALMADQQERLALLAAEEGGKPYMDSKVEVDRAINGVKLAIAALYNLKGEEVPMGLTRASENRVAFTIQEPIGVVVAISAFNHPLNLIIHQVIPAVATGCPVIVKPASATPRSAFNLVKLLYEAGLPEDYCQVLVCRSTLAEKLATDSRVSYVSFIGSAKTGWHLRSKIASGTRIALEHGGAAPVIIDDTVNTDEITAPLMKGGFYHSGQVCVSVQRIFVQKNIAEKLAQNMAEQATQLKTGDPLLKDTEAGPLIVPQEVERIDRWVQEANTGQGVILCGGKRLSESIYAPTVLWNPSPKALVSTQEIFGPVVCIYPYTDKEKALAQANALPLSFQAAVFSKNIDFAMEMVKKLNASAVMLNDHTAFRVDWMPFGGREHSGLGWGGIPYSMEEMCRKKMILIKSSW